MLSRVVIKKQRGRRLLAAMATLSIVAGTFLVAGTVLAVHDTGAFELDGNATNNPAIPGDDWDNVCHQVTGIDCSTANNTTGATSVSWSAEPDHSASIFTGGGSKDPIDISSWAWKDGGGLPDKDNLLHAFSARYSLPIDTTPPTLCPATSPATTCDLLFFGSDRFDNSGDAQQGFWFFQNKIGLAGGNSGGGTGFTGVHKNGDLLVISDFSNGGTVSTMTIYKWDSTVSGNLALLATSTSANCGTAAPGDSFCGLVNPGLITMPWQFVDKSATPANGALNGEFYEGGINLSLLGLSGECFSSQLSETRSSTSTTATLKDFILSQGPACVPNLTTQASATVASPLTPGTPVHDTATIQVSGATNPADATGTVTFFLCGPSATGACTSATSGGTAAGTCTLVGGLNTTDGLSSCNSSPEVNTATSKLAPGTYCFRATYGGDSLYGATSATNLTTECFAVKDTSTTTTAQNWLPQDSATVTTAGGTAVSGSVVFTLYPSADCTGLGTIVPTNTGTSSPFTTNNTTVYFSPGTTISWRAVFTPTDPNAVVGSTSHCETSTLTINNDIGS